MRKRPKKIIPLTAAAVLIIVTLISIFVPFNDTVTGPGCLAAQAEWTVLQAEQDKLQTRLVYNDLNAAASVALFHVNRPDYLLFSVKEGLAVGDRLAADEIVAQLSSIEDRLRLAAVMGQLEQANAQLAALRTGAKRPLQEEADQALQYARAQLAAYEPILRRQQELFAQKLISSQEYEIVKAQFDLYQIDVALKEAQLKTARTGEKAEVLAVAEAQIRTAGSQLELLQKKASAEIVRTPIAGVLAAPDAAVGELLHVCKTDTLVMQMPVKATEVQYVKPGQKVIVHITGLGKQKQAVSVIGISPNSRMVHLQPMYIATAYLDNSDQKLLPGMTGTFVILTDQITLSAMVSRSWKNFRFNK